MPLSLLLLTFSFLNPASADKIPPMKTEYVKTPTTEILDPTTFKPIGRLERHQALRPKIILRDGKPLTHNGAIHIGFDLEDGGKAPLGVVAIKDLTVVKPLHVSEPERIKIEPELMRALTAQLDQLSKGAFCKASHYANKTEMDLLEEFHNTHCPEINRDGKGNRSELLLQTWDRFIEEKGKVSAKARELAAKAKELDIVTRTALYESSYDLGCTAKGTCEKDLVILSIKNRAESSKCDKGNRLFNCGFRKDYIGVATSPSQYNVWMESFALVTHVTGCFLRRDLQANANPKATWKTPKGEIDKEKEEGFQKRIVMYKDTLLRTKKILGANDTELQEIFGNGPDVRKILYYYHPGSMEKCNPKTYARSAWVEAAYAKVGSAYTLVRRERIMPGLQRDGILAFEVYNIDGDPTSLYPNVVLNEKDVDFTHGYACVPQGIRENCSTPSGQTIYRKAPKWSLEPSQEYASIQCPQAQDRGLDCNPTVAQRSPVRFSGACDNYVSFPLGVR